MIFMLFFLRIVMYKVQYRLCNPTSREAIYCVSKNKQKQACKPAFVV